MKRRGRLQPPRGPLRRVVGGVAMAATLAALLSQGGPGRAQALPQPPAQIPSLSEPGEGLAIDLRAPRTGLVRFAASRGRGILVSVQANAPAETRARSFLGLYGAAFGISRDAQQVTLQRVRGDALGMEHVRFSQIHLGVPVTAGELVVHLRGSRVMAANGRILDQLPASVAPGLTAPAATATAAAVVARRYPALAAGAAYQAPRLEIFNREMLGEPGGLTRLAWFVEVTGRGLREFVWVDAESGGVLLNFSQLTEARQRLTYDGMDGASLPGTLARGEGDAPTGNTDVDLAHDYAGDTYDFFFDHFGRDSYDDAGATLISTADHCPTPSDCPYPNAFWNGTQMVYGNGFPAADDVVGHELTHAVTEYSANLFYYYQSGALNESFSDIFGESMDLANGAGSDGAGQRWLVGEDIPGVGAIRHMASPTTFGDPGKLSDPEFFCVENAWVNPAGDSGGVHINSGVPNKAYTLMVDGGSYNGRTVAGIGLAKAQAVQYRALTVYLTSGATFLDNVAAVVQACADLVGTLGISPGDCTQVRAAVEAVEMDQTWNCAGATPPPSFCPTGAPPVTTLFQDDFEAGLANTQWSFGSGWSLISGGVYVRGGSWAVYGQNLGTTSLHALTRTSATAPLPADAYLYFEQSFEFEILGATSYDGAVIEYSTDGGTTWIDAGPLIDAGQAYNATLYEHPGDPTATNPLAGRPAFARSSYGFTATRLSLAPLAGQAVRFRFVVGTDAIVPSLGQIIDNVQVYTCSASDPEMIVNGDFSGGSTDGLPSGWLRFAEPTPGDIEVTNTGNRLNFSRPAGSTQAVVFQQTGIPVGTGVALQASFALGNTDTVRKRVSVLMHDEDFSDLTFCTFWLPALAPLQTYLMRAHTTEAWTGATLSFYAASTGSGFYQVDDVSMQLAPTASTVQTDCVDPLAPGSTTTDGAELLTNGTFAAGLAGWAVWGQLSVQAPAGQLELFRLAGTPAGVVFQNTGAAMAAGDDLLLTFRLGNSSGVRQRITLLVHDADFSDLHACTFFVPPGLPLSDFAVRTWATTAWANATVSIYPSSPGTAPAYEWLRLDDVSLRTTSGGAAGTECFEPGASPG